MFFFFGIEIVNVCFGVYVWVGVDGFSFLK